MTLIEFKTTMNIAGIPEVKEGIYQIPSTDIEFNIIYSPDMKVLLVGGKQLALALGYEE